MVVISLTCLLDYEIYRKQLQPGRHAYSETILREASTPNLSGLRMNSPNREMSM